MASASMVVSLQDMLLNMICRMQQLNINNYVIAAFDGDAFAFCQRSVRTNHGPVCAPLYFTSCRPITRYHFCDEGSPNR